MSEPKTESVEQTPKGDISFEIGFKEKTRFDLRLISVAEEKAVTEKLTNLADLDDDEKKSEKEYQVYLTALVESSESAEAGEAIRRKFQDRTANKYNEREIYSAYWTFKQKLQPDVVF